MLHSKRPRMSAEEATSFSGFSVANATTVTAALQRGCAPYVDVFTLPRWMPKGSRSSRANTLSASPSSRSVLRKMMRGILLPGRSDGCRVSSADIRWNRLTGAQQTGRSTPRSIPGKLSGKSCQERKRHEV